LLYTTWDPETLGGGGQKPQYSKAYKQDAADALRCAMWGVWGHVPVKKEMARLSDVEREAARVASGAAYKKEPPKRQDKYEMPVGRDGFMSGAETHKDSKRVDKYGRTNRGY
jgi:hypothetical protein